MSSVRILPQIFPPTPKPFKLSDQQTRISLPARSVLLVPRANTLAANMLATTQLFPTLPVLPSPKAHLSGHVVHDHARSMDALLREVQASFESQLPIETLLSLSQKLQAELKEHLVSSPQCMLPSHNYILPTGKERGTYLALEVGGSNLRVALVDLGGRKNGKPILKIRRSENSPITMAVRRLEGLEFFDWIAERIREMLAMDKEAYSQMLSKPLRMGVAWAFPIEYVYASCMLSRNDCF